MKDENLLYLKNQTKTVSLQVWESGIYPKDKWKCYAYSEYHCGIPKYAEIRRLP